MGKGPLVIPKAALDEIRARLAGETGPTHNSGCEPAKVATVAKVGSSPVQLSQVSQLSQPARPVAADLPDRTAQKLEAIEERAGILGHDAGLPREWAEGAARLLAGLPPPLGCDPARWDQLRDDAAALIEDGWVSKASALGWDVREIFGAMPGVPEARYDAQGLVWVMRGFRVLDLDIKGATIAATRGGRVRFYRRPADDPRPPQSVLAWDLSAHDPV